MSQWGGSLTVLLSVGVWKAKRVIKRPPSPRVAQTQEETDLSAVKMKDLCLS